MGRNVVYTDRIPQTAQIVLFFSLFLDRRMTICHRPSRVFSGRYRKVNNHRTTVYWTYLKYRSLGKQNSPTKRLFLTFKGSISTISLGPKNDSKCHVRMKIWWWDAVQDHFCSFFVYIRWSDITTAKLGLSCVSSQPTQYKDPLNITDFLPLPLKNRFTKTKLCPPFL